MRPRVPIRPSILRPLMRIPVGAVALACIVLWMGANRLRPAWLGATSRSSVLFLSLYGPEGARQPVMQVGEGASRGWSLADSEHGGTHASPGASGGILYTPSLSVQVEIHDTNEQQPAFLRALGFVPILSHSWLIVRGFIPDQNTPTDLSPADLEGLRPLLGRELQRANPKADWAERFNNGELHRTSIVPGAIRYDLCVVVRLVAALLAAAALLRALIARPHETRAGRRALGLCAKCGYPVAGTRGDRCPECGETIRQWE